MPDLPRIVRATPGGRITRPDKGIPVIATIRWHHGVDQEVLAVAIAWTAQAVEIRWEMERGQGRRTDWVPARDIRREGAEPRPVNLPPHLRAGGRSEPHD
jgi:hypothetical protein